MRGETNITSVLMGGVQDRVNAKAIKTGTEITSYNTDTNMYTLPSDGYLMVRSGGTSGDSILVNIGAATLLATKNNGAEERNALYAKKGMSVYVSFNTGSRGHAYFYPIG